jgi:surface protein
VNPLKERSRAFICCLYELHRRNSLLCFTAAFIDKIFRPYLLNKLSRWDGDIQAAVDLWCSDFAAAEEQYGHISKWDVSHVTNMSRLFDGKVAFNEDIRAWDVGSVTSMGYKFGGAKSFNQPIGNWNVSKVTTMERMFLNCPILPKNEARRK